MVFNIFKRLCSNKEIKESVKEETPVREISPPLHRIYKKYSEDYPKGEVAVQLKGQPKEKVIATLYDIVMQDQQLRALGTLVQGKIVTIAEGEICNSILDYMDLEIDKSGLFINSTFSADFLRPGRKTENIYDRERVLEYLNKFSDRPDYIRGNIARYIGRASKKFMEAIKIKGDKD